MEKFADYNKILNVNASKVLISVLNTPEMKKELINYNQIEQLSEGIDAREERIVTISAEEQARGNVYSIYTIQERQKQGLQVDNVDLNESGIFWSTFDVEVTEKETKFLADFNVHGEDIRDNFKLEYDFLGLTPDNLENFVWQSFWEPFSKAYRQSLGLD